MAQQDIDRKRVNLNLRNVSIKEALTEVQQQSGIRFMYDEDIRKYAKIRVNLTERNIPIKDAVTSILSRTNLTFEFTEGYLMIRERETPSQTPRQTRNNLTGQILEVNTAKAIPGATVRIVEIGKITVSDNDGFYEFPALPLGNYTVEVSYIGQETQKSQVTINAGKDIILNIGLDGASSQSLNEVVVVGYGTQEKKDVTTSIASLKADEINSFSGVGIDKAMTGKMAGVQVIETSGAPGSGISIKVRGSSTITAGTMPLYVIDGVPMSDQDDSGSGKRVNSLNDLNLQDVESIEVLKDASAAAIYGSRGSNGVVLITTKRGITGKPLIAYNSFGGWQETTKKMEMLDAYQYAQLVYDSHNNTYLDLLADQGKQGSISDGNDIRRANIGNNSAALIPPDLWPYIRGEQGLVDTDWQDQVLRQAAIQNHSLSVRGGSDNIKYYFSGNYVDQDGIVKGSGMEMINGRLNLDAQYNRLKLGTSINVTSTVYNWIPSEGRHTDENIVSSALAMSPTMPVYNSDGSYNFDQYSWGYSRAQVVNPVALAALKDDQMDQIRFKGNVFAEYELDRGLTLRTLFGYNVKDWQRAQFRPSTLPNEATRITPSIPSATSRTKRNVNWVSETTLKFKRKFGSHGINALAGFTAQKEHSSANLVAGTGYQNDLVKTLNYATTITDWSSTVQEWSLLSWLGRVQYDYEGRYLLSAAVRTDGSSRFGTNNRWGYFPSVSAGWNVAEEGFLKDNLVISTLKIRASYGQTGNFGIGNYAYLSRISQDNYILGAVDGRLAAGMVPSTSGNQNLKWEKNSMINLGTDIGLWNNSVNLQFDIYNSNTSDLLLDLPIPSTSGFATALRNVGKVNNKGIELVVNTNHQLGGLRMAHNANFSANRNKVVDLGGLNEIISTSDNVIYFVTRVGEPTASYQTLVTDGLYRSESELNDPDIPKVPGARPGDFKFVDQDGNNIIDGNDRIATGNYQPKFIYGYTSSLGYGIFDLSVAIQGTYGNKVGNIAKRYIDNMEGNTNNMVTALNRWVSEENPGDGQTIRANRTAKGLNGQISTWHIEDGSYLRIRDITFGVSLPNTLMHKIGVSRLRIYASLINPFTFTKYSGFNPEVSTRDNPLTPGVDYGTYPIAKSYNMGINLEF
ncbi:SusC/RagA family TonB-linked outer membrane protein [Sphingobacterium haloxyli]|nr:TonB-dependent receptor [Sphingobacterium haloxyli]